jgi:hypothetical protein
MKSHELRKAIGTCGYSELKCMISLLSKKFEFELSVYKDKGNPLVRLKLDGTEHIIIFSPSKGWSLNFKSYKSYVNLYTVLSRYY